MDSLPSPDTIFYHNVKTTIDIASPIPHCGQCDTKGNLLRCSRCAIMHYCNREHQTAHYHIHKAACSKISKARASVEAEEQRLRNDPGDFLMQADPFTNSVGHFWGIFETRTYMRHRFILVSRLQMIHTHASVKTQLEHMQDMMRLCRGDNLGVRLMIPALMLRLNLDQECYDFVKWYRTVGNDPEYDWGDMSIGFLDVRDADVFEDVGYLCRERGELAFMVSLTLLKIKLLLDLQNMSKAKEDYGPKVPNEILDRIQQLVARSPIISKRKEVVETKNYSRLMEELKVQIKALYEATHKSNELFWAALLRPSRHLTTRMTEYRSGPLQEMQLALQYTYNAWKETTGSIEIIEAIQR